MDSEYWIDLAQQMTDWMEASGVITDPVQFWGGAMHGAYDRGVQDGIMQERARAGAANTADMADRYERAQARAKRHSELLDEGQ